MKTKLLKLAMKNWTENSFNLTWHTNPRNLILVKSLEESVFMPLRFTWSSLSLWHVFQRSQLWSYQPRSPMTKGKTMIGVPNSLFPSAVLSFSTLEIGLDGSWENDLDGPNLADLECGSHSFYLCFVLDLCLCSSIAMLIHHKDTWRTFSSTRITITLVIFFNTFSYSYFLNFIESIR